MFNLIFIIYIFQKRNYLLIYILLILKAIIMYFFKKLLSLRHFNYYLIEILLKTLNIYLTFTKTLHLYIIDLIICINWIIIRNHYQLEKYNKIWKLIKYCTIFFTINKIQKI